MGTKPTNERLDEIHKLIADSRNRTDQFAFEVWKRFLRAFDNAIRNGSSNNIKEAFDNLTAQGFTEEEAKLIVFVEYLKEMERAFSSEEDYDALSFSQVLLSTSIVQERQNVYDRVSDLIKVAVPIVGFTKIAVELIKAWVEDRKGRCIKIKKGDYEMEIQGGVNSKEIEERFKQFKEHSKDTDIEIKIIDS